LPTVLEPAGGSGTGRPQEVHPGEVHPGESKVSSGPAPTLVEAVFPLERAAEGHQLGDTGRVTGKVVLTVS
jgi:NADPH:quinone reductase-like Zn-dependent oxidoreductase